MKEYLDKVFKPALASFHSGKVALGFLVSFIPVLNLFFAPGYAFAVGRNLGKGKSELPAFKLGRILSIAITTYIPILLFLLFLGVLSVPVTLLYSLSRSLITNTSVLTAANFSTLFSVPLFLNVFWALVLAASFIFPLMIVRYQIYNYYSRIFDLHHILKLACTKEYIFSFIIATSLSFVSSSLLSNLGSNQLYLLLGPPVYFVIWLLAFALYGRTFYILEEEYKIDHIPDHAKSEIQPTP